MADDDRIVDTGPIEVAVDFGGDHGVAVAL
jgi:hypothetical protein